MPVPLTEWCAWQGTGVESRCAEAFMKMYPVATAVLLLDRKGNLTLKWNSVSSRALPNPSFFCVFCLIMILYSFKYILHFH